jgi:hypothetical protein
VEGGVRWEELARPPRPEGAAEPLPLFGEDTDEDVDDDAETRDLSRTAAGLPPPGVTEEEDRDTWPMDVEELHFDGQQPPFEDPLSEEIWRRPATEGPEEDTETDLGGAPDRRPDPWSTELSLPELPEDVERELADNAPEEGPTIEDLDLDDDV